MLPDSHYRCVSLEPTRRDVAAELKAGLTARRKTLPCKWLYDEAGSELFERITELPEYYPTRTEGRILANKSAAIVELCPGPLSLVELGSGSSKKTRHLIRACLERQRRLTYYPIDISPAALDMAARQFLHDFDRLEVVGLVGEYSAGLEYLSRRPGEPHLVAFLGSTVGNFDEQEADEFFAMLRKRLRRDAGDRFLLGFDLLKDESILVPAYDDAAGVTAEFNLNLLARLNREFGADFDLSAFRHKALFNRQRSRIEMHLVSQQAQTVRVPGLGLELKFARGETIHTENSYKHSREAMRELLQRHGFEVTVSFTDARQLFCLYLAQ